jgi:hypothetical protein
MMGARCLPEIPVGAERAHTTCRLQHRSLHVYLTETLTAHARGDLVPLRSPEEPRPPGQATS